jgi:hypothetical protein
LINREKLIACCGLGSDVQLRKSHQHKLEIRAKGRKVRKGDDRYELREPEAAYDALFTPENGLLRVENGFYWNELFEQSIP